MVNLHTWRAAFAFGVMKRTGAVKARPDELEHPAGFATVNGETEAVVSEWRAGGEVVARKVEALNRVVVWLRPDIAIEAELALEYDREKTERDRVRVAGEVLKFTRERDEDNAERRGITPEEYKRERLARDHRRTMRSGVNSRGMR
jgi:hypothetical protein